MNRSAAFSQYKPPDRTGRPNLESWEREASVMTYIGALDLGTTSNRFMLFDHKGRVIGMDQMEHRQIYPQPGWVEHDPMEIWANTGTVIRNALNKAGCHGKEIQAIGITNQRETTVVWNRETGKPYCNAIVWQCTRSADICDALGREHGQDRYRQKTGLPIATYFSGPKLLWVLDNVPGVRGGCGKRHCSFRHHRNLDHLVADRRPEWGASTSPMLPMPAGPC